MKKSLDRFIEYVKIDTQSDANSNTTPSAMKEFDLLNILKDEMIALGVQDVELESSGVLYGTIPANTDEKIDAIGFLAHVDTASEASGKNVLPRIVTNYDGKNIVLNKELNIVMSPDEFPSLKNHVGKSLVVTDGTTLLGADDKAGVAEVMTLVDYLLSHKEIIHGPIKIAFTPDEEVGRGTDSFDIKKFGADFAFTVDGGTVNEYEYENFNAAAAKVLISGLSCHPGSAKNIMINAQLIAIEFNSMLNPNMVPSKTEGYEGFNHMLNMKGEVESAELNYIIRNHNRELLEEQKRSFVEIANKINSKYQKELVKVEIKDSYYNMAELILKHPNIISLAKDAITNVGLVPVANPIRGGTDGARLTYDGLPCPNLGTGGYNYHGRFEYLVIEEMEKSVEVLIEIVKLTASRKTIL